MGFGSWIGIMGDQMSKRFCNLRFLGFNALLFRRVGDYR